MGAISDDGKLTLDELNSLRMILRQILEYLQIIYEKLEENIAASNRIYSFIDMASLSKSGMVSPDEVKELLDYGFKLTPEFMEVSCRLLEFRADLVKRRDTLSFAQQASSQEMLRLFESIKCCVNQMSVLSSMFQMVGQDRESALSDLSKLADSSMMICSRWEMRSGYKIELHEDVVGIDRSESWRKCCDRWSGMKDLERNLHCSLWRFSDILLEELKMIEEIMESLYMTCVYASPPHTSIRVIYIDDLKRDSLITSKHMLTQT